MDFLEGLKKQWLMGVVVIVAVTVGTTWNVAPEVHSAEIEPEQLGERLDTIFGERNWFVYPGVWNQIGVTRVPAGLRVVEPIYEIDSAVGHFRRGQVVPEIVGANVTLSQVIGPSDIPSWQRNPLKRWQVEKNQDRDGITRTRINAIFGNATWKKNSEYEFSAIGTLTRNLPLAYPIVSVDSNDGKHGIGSPDIHAGQSVTLWFAGGIDETKSFWSDWSDGMKWLMGILGSLIIAALIWVVKFVFSGDRKRGKPRPTPADRADGKRRRRSSA